MCPLLTELIKKKGKTCLFSRHLWIKSSRTFLNTVTVCKTYSSSEAICLDIEENDTISPTVTTVSSRKYSLGTPRNDHACQTFILIGPVFCKVPVTLRQIGTWIWIRPSLLLHPKGFEGWNRKTYFGTATISVSRYSLSSTRCSFFTMSSNDRWERLPLLRHC